MADAPELDRSVPPLGDGALVARRGLSASYGSRGSRTTSGISRSVRRW
jgi:hypothetical protein